MKGFKDKNNKFHPITQSKGVRKSRDQSAKLQGVRMKKDLPQKLPKAYTPAWNKLKDEVDRRVDKDFNEIRLDNVQKVNENYFEDIITTEPKMEDVKDFFGDSDLTNAQFEKKHDENEIEEAKDELRRGQEEIMWSTLFEAKDQFLADKIIEMSDKVINDAGFTIIDMSRSNDGEYQTGVFLGVNGAGYDFYEAHWVPLYRLFGWV